MRRHYILESRRAHDRTRRAHHVDIMFNERLVPMPVFAALGATDGTSEAGPLCRRPW